MTPLVSVILPVYNQEDFIVEAVVSLLKQTFTNLEILVVDDACTDSSIPLVEQLHDSRIRIIRNEANIGLAASVNKAIRESRGNYIARMDADDVALRHRIENQVKFLEKHPDVDVLGGAMQSFGFGDYLHKFPLGHEACKAQLLFNVCFGHPTVMFRRSVFDRRENFYKEELKQYSEEYELWCRLCDKVRYANLDTTILLYRTFKPTDKSGAAEKRKINSLNIRTAFLKEQWKVDDVRSAQLHDDIANLRKASNSSVFDEWVAWIETMRQLNIRYKTFDQLALEFELDKRFFELCYWNTHLGVKQLTRWFTRTEKRFKPSLSQLIKFIAKTLKS